MDRQVAFSPAIWVNGRRINVTATRRCSRLGSIVSSSGTRRQLGIFFSHLFVTRMRDRECLRATT